MAHSEHREDELLSVSTTPTGLPTFIDGPNSPTQSVHTEIGSVSQVRQSSQGLRNIDLFDAADDPERRESVISNYPEGSIIGIKSPHETIFGSSIASTPAESQFGTPTETARYSVLSEHPDRSSVRALAPRPPRRASVDSESAVKHKQTELQTPVDNGDEVAEFTAYPEGSTKGIKSPKSPTDTIASTTTTQTVDPVKTASTGARAERSLHVPFLPNFLRATETSPSATESPVLGSPQGSPKLKYFRSAYWRQGDEERQRGTKQISRHQDLKEALAEGPPARSQSAFDSNSSDEDEHGAGAAVIEAATTARVKRPQLIEHRSSRLIGKDPMDDGVDNPGPSRGKAARFLGTNIATLRALENNPNDLAEELPVNGRLGLASAPLPALPSNEPAISSTQNDPRIHLQNGLRSHPVLRAKTIPVRAKRKVNFSPLPLEEIKPEHRALRQSVVSTPYPVDGNGAHGMDVVVFLHLSGLRRGSRRLGNVVVPGRRKEKGSDEAGKVALGSPKGGKPDFDDQNLFRLVNSEYRRRRGHFRVVAGARSLHCVRLRPDSSKTEVDGHRDLSLAEDSSTTSMRLTRLFHSPSTGKGKHDCVNFITNTSTHDTVTFELVEDWSIRRIALAVVAAVVASLAATLLWVFLGTGGGGQVIEGLGGGFNSGNMGFRDAGGRVEAGVALGVLVLLMGWTGVGAWVGLCWVG